MNPKQLTHPSISFLLPAFNNDCSSLVEALCRQADRLVADSGGCFDYEVIVGDDCSPLPQYVEANRKACAHPHCRFYRHETNVRLARNRNSLARLASKDFVVFIDSDLGLGSDRFVERYAMYDGPDVVSGGIRIEGDPRTMRSNLRYVYAKAGEEAHRAVHRQRNPYKDFNAANLFIRRELILQYPFDERIQRYGYEDVLFGRELQRDSVSVGYIDNEVTFHTFETNESFVNKTDQSLLTLYEFRDDLRGYSRIQTMAERLDRMHLLPFVQAAFRIVGPLLRRNILGRHPELLAYNLYRLGFYASLME